MGKLERKRSYFSLLNLKLARVLLSFGVKGHLVETGWVNSFLQRASVDSDGKHLPWTTYSYTHFIQDRLNKNQSIFEYGAGASTMYYADRVSKVVAVEHDAEWYAKLSALAPSNVELIHCTLATNGEYCRAALSYDTLFQIIIVDGRDRVNCCKQAVKALTTDGVIILDDSEREKYAEAITFLRKTGFKQLRFAGLAPGLIINKETSVFYRSENCLDI